MNATENKEPLEQSVPEDGYSTDGSLALESDEEATTPPPSPPPQPKLVRQKAQTVPEKKRRRVTTKVIENLAKARAEKKRLAAVRAMQKAGGVHAERASQWQNSRMRKSKHDRDTVALSNAYATLGILEAQEEETRQEKAEQKQEERFIEYKRPRTKMAQFF